MSRDELPDQSRFPFAEPPPRWQDRPKPEAEAESKGEAEGAAPREGPEPEGDREAADGEGAE